MQAVMHLSDLKQAESGANAGAGAGAGAGTVASTARPTDVQAGARSPAASVAAQAQATRSVFLPLLLALLALVALLAHQLWLLNADRVQLDAALQNQAPTVNNAVGLRKSLDALAADTQRLADAGNPNARLLVEELRKRGITIQTPAAGAGAAQAAAASSR